MVRDDLMRLLLAVSGAIASGLYMARSLKHEREIAELEADAAYLEIERARHRDWLCGTASTVAELTCQAQQHRVEDVTSLGVTVARLCVDCDRQLDAPEWLTVNA